MTPKPESGHKLLGLAKTLRNTATSLTEMDIGLDT